MIIRQFSDLKMENATLKDQLEEITQYNYQSKIQMADEINLMNEEIKEIRSQLIVQKLAYTEMKYEFDLINHHNKSKKK